LPLSGLQPIELSITTPAGDRNEYSGYHCATGGVLDIPFVVALNDEHGQWTVDASDLTAGLTARRTFEIGD
jgi:hypothetical protein